MDWNQCPAVERIEGKVSGALLFSDTRVPVSTLFRNLAAEVNVAEYLTLYPDVSAEQVTQVLQYVSENIEGDLGI